MEREEAVVDEHIPYEEEIEPFNWEDLLYESWLEEQWRQKRKRPAQGPIQINEVVKIGTRAIISIDGSQRPADRPPPVHPTF